MGNELQHCHGKRNIQIEEEFLTSKLDLNIKKKEVKCYFWRIDGYGAENWKLRKIDQNNQKSFEMWCWRRMENISLAVRVKIKTITQNEGVMEYDNAI